jgi:hypothetical protein
LPAPVSAGAEPAPVTAVEASASVATASADAKLRMMIVPPVNPFAEKRIGF